MEKFDAIVVGSGPNGLAAAITLQREGISVLVVEGKDTPGGGMRTQELTLPGFHNDVCSSVHPLGADSPVFRQFELEKFGLEYLAPKYAVAHPFDDGHAIAISREVEKSAEQFGKDEESYQKLYRFFVEHWPELRSAYVAPLHYSQPSFAKLKFGWYAASSAAHFAKNHFKTNQARALFAGMGAHSILPLGKLATSSIGIVLNTLAHVNGWPLPKGGANAITKSLVSCFKSLGGKLETSHMVEHFEGLPPAKVVLFDVTPHQLVTIASKQLSENYKRRLANYTYGAGIFKVDWALSAPVPFTNAKCREAPTVHIGGNFEEIVESESLIGNKMHPEKPFVLFVQPTVLDTSRAPEGKHIAWAYCHVPNGSEKDMTNVIEAQVERFAPGFKDCVIGRHIMNTREIENYNPNYVGGDINGGAATIDQVFTRPVASLSPYQTSAKNIYLCSSSTPPGGGVHGICGYYAARSVLRDWFNIKIERI